MTKQKLYVIRKIGFEYGDDWYYNNGMAGYYGNYSDLKSAQDALEKAENKIYREFYLIQFLFGDNQNSDAAQRAQKFDQYIKKYFGISIKKGDGLWDYDEFFKIPENATDDQIEEIRNIIKISFYTILEIEKESEKDLKFVIATTDKNSHLDQVEYGDPLLSKIFDTEMEAYAALIQGKGFTRDSEVNGFSGNMNRLSDLPDLLKNYIESCSSWELYQYSTDYWMIVKTQTGPNFIKEFKGIVPLLKNPWYKIIQI